MSSEQKLGQAQIQSMIDAMYEADDRVAAIIFTSSVELLLENLLRKAMMPDSAKHLFDGNGALATLSAKIDIAYAFGLIANVDRHDLHLLRKIRNDFAHDIDHELSFETPRIADRVQCFQVIKELESNTSFNSELGSKRRCFDFGVGGLIVRLKDHYLLKASSPTDPGYGFNPPMR
jgi:DNA-binding MltR family transcriptional regulator